ncbi:MAG: hypothetical protein KGO82_14370 [Bacteroidota bacterium]|nr:hypothetical protein [Bacteroidota bacterium]
MKRGGYILTAIASFLLGYFLAGNCIGKSKSDKELLATQDTLHQVRGELKLKDSALNNMTAAATDAGYEALQANMQVDTLQKQVRYWQAYAGQLAADHWRFRDAKDTANYIINCDQMAGQLSLSRDSVHNLQAAINALNYGIDHYQDKSAEYQQKLDSVNRELLSLKNDYRALADHAIAQVDTVTAAILHEKYKPQIYFGGTIQTSLGFGPKTQIVSGRNMYGGSVLFGPNKPVYQFNYLRQINFRKPHF